MEIMFYYVHYKTGLASLFLGVYHLTFKIYILLIIGKIIKNETTKNELIK